MLARQSLRVFAVGGRLVGRNDPAEGWPNVDATFRPGTTSVVVARVHGSQSTVFELATGRTLFNGTGVFDGIAFSPDGRWLAISWPTADQWVFVGIGRPLRIRAVAGIEEQFRGRAAISGWCCG